MVGIQELHSNVIVNTKNFRTSISKDLSTIHRWNDNKELNVRFLP
jgi:hypothetical protein